VKVEPGAADLLEIARATILADVAPSLPEDKRYAALMAANALAIAGREIAASDSTAAELARIGALLPEPAPPGDDRTAIREATSRLARAIREGRFDEGEPRTRLLAHLRECVRARLAVSNPRALARDERTPT
jgi:hypothetical protein